MRPATPRREAARMMHRTFGVTVVALRERAWCVGVRGDLDLATAPRLKAVLADLIADGAVDVVVDLCGVAALDSTGLAVLATAQRRLSQAGGELSVAVADDDT